MRYQLIKKNGVNEAKLREKVTFSDLEEFREMIDHMLAERAVENIIDLSEVDFIDSAGLGMLLLARDEISKASSRLILRGPQGQVKRMFVVARFDKMFDIE
ncbi:STAS domain-containing protein [Luteithermobacter gelatinilyticus]|uniref:STAS domain-containing protein n=1 Tax=Luteithermobacter gelatinilyticus TaxID=2582913 RepID=UPI0011060703|nr:STAS domain-containing protein [Luteithermobacter gelatinilyticus]